MLGSLCLCASLFGSGLSAPTRGDRFDELVVQLNANSGKERAQAVRGLAELGTGAAWKKVLGALKDPDSMVADQAELVLADVKEGDPLELVLGKDGLSNGDDWVRLRVAEALGRMGAKLDVASWTKALKDKSPAVRHMAAWSVERRAAELADLDAGILAAELEKLATKDKYVLVRASACTAASELAGAPGREGLLAQVARDDESEARAAAAWCARNLSTEKALALLAPLVADPAQNVRSAAAAAIGELPRESDGRVAGAALLVEQLFAEKELKNRIELWNLLRRLSNFSYSLQADGWKKWAEDPKPREATPESVSSLDETATRTHFVGLPIQSERVCFLIDLSGSMWEAREGQTRKARADVELANALKALKPPVLFNLIPYTATPIPWEKKLVAATPASLKRAEDFFAGRKDQGKGNFVDAFELAIADPAVDTVVVLCDGAPTGGRRWNLELIKALVAERNRYRRVRLSAVLFDCRGKLLEHWREMCEASGGSILTSDLGFR